VAPQAALADADSVTTTVPDPDAGSMVLRQISERALLVLVAVPPGISTSASPLNVTPATVTPASSLMETSTRSSRLEPDPTRCAHVNVVPKFAVQKDDGVSATTCGTGVFVGVAVFVGVKVCVDV
jgi:hypothetical protein